MPGRITTSCPTILGWFFSPKSPDHTRAADRASPLPRRAKSERSVPRVEQPDQQIHHEGTESTKSSRRSAAEVRSRLGATPLHTSLRVLRVFVVDCLDVTLLAEETAKQFVTCESGTPVNRSVLDNSISAGHLRLPAVSKRVINGSVLDNSIRGLSKRPPFHGFSEHFCGAGLLDLVADRKMISVQGRRRQPVEVFANL